MIKKLILLLSLVCFLAIPAGAWEIDSSKVFVNATGFVALPTLDGAGTYDYNLGFQIEGHYRLGEKFSMGATYKDWRLDDESNSQILTTEFKAGIFTYWVNPYGSLFNLGWVCELGQAKTVSEEGISKNLGIIAGVTLQRYIYENIYCVGTVKVGKLGEPKGDNLPEQECLLISVGIGTAF